MGSSRNVRDRMDADRIHRRSDGFAGSSSVLYAEHSVDRILLERNPAEPRVAREFRWPNNFEQTVNFRNTVNTAVTGLGRAEELDFGSDQSMHILATNKNSHYFYCFGMWSVEHHVAREIGDQLCPNAKESRVD